MTLRTWANVFDVPRVTLVDDDRKNIARSRPRALQAVVKEQTKVLPGLDL